MKKMPIPPDSDFTDQGYFPSNQQLYYPRQDNGNLLESAPHISSSLGLQQARYDDFMSDDGQFV